MKKAAFIFLIISFISCQEKKQENKIDVIKDQKKEQKNESFQIYKMSEMAALMETMYADHKRMKSEIIAGKTNRK